MDIQLIIAAVEALPALIAGIGSLISGTQAIANGSATATATPEQLATLQTALNNAQAAHAAFLAAQAAATPPAA
jgi:hypothetical protein